MSKIMINSVLLKENIESISMERFLEIKKRSKFENIKAFKSKDTLYPTAYTYNKEKKAYEIIKNSKNKDLNNVEKMIFVSNMLIPDDKSFSKNLLLKGYNKQKLEEINNLLQSIKRMPNDVQEKVLNCELFIEYAYFAKLYYGLDNPHILINKSNEILAIQPQLLIKR